MIFTVTSRSYFRPAVVLAALVITVAATDMPAAMFLENTAAPSSNLPQEPDLRQAKAPMQRYDHGQPDSEAQYLLELTNRARANPGLEGYALVQSDDPDILRAYRAYGIQSELIVEQFITYDAQPPLAFNGALATAAGAHAIDMQQNDFQDHYGTDGGGPGQRISAAGYQYRLAGENVYSYAYSLDYCHAGFLVDWGVPTLGHRNNIMNINGRARFREVGIVVLADDNPASRVGPLIVVQDFGRQLLDRYAFITGAVYEDNNGNEMYDIGEGVADVRIVPDHGVYYAVTSSSGGYAVPVPLDGDSYQVTASGDRFSPVTTTVTMYGQNVKLDFVVTSSEQSSGTGDGTERISDYANLAVVNHTKSIDSTILSQASGVLCPATATVLFAMIVLLGCLPQRP